MQWGEACDAQNGSFCIENTHGFRTANRHRSMEGGRQKGAARIDLVLFACTQVLQDGLDLLIKRITDCGRNLRTQRRERSTKDFHKCTGGSQSPEGAIASFRTVNDSEPLDVTTALQTRRKLASNDLGQIEVHRDVLIEPAHDPPLGLR